MSTSVLTELLKEYEKTRNVNNLKLLDKKSTLYKANPRLQEIEDELISCSIAFSKATIVKNLKEIDSLNKKIYELSKEKDTLLNTLGKSKNYLSLDYSCKLCKDTGYIIDNHNSIMCSCLKQKLFDISYNKSNFSNLEKENFDTFNLSLFSDKADEKKYGIEISPRQNMEDLKTYALDFIQNFDNPDQKNLIFSGKPGRGKTFLSNCIVKELLCKGKTVLYQTAPIMLDKIIEEVFNRDYTKQSILESILTVDLLVIDDLGTETMNSMKFTELYKIINTRLLNQNGQITKTIISTNLSLQALYANYDERLVSRFFRTL